MSKWINECHTDPCQSGGTCEDLEDGYRLINFRKSFFFTNLSGYFLGNSTEMTYHEEFLFISSDNAEFSKMEAILRAKVMIFFKSENSKKRF